MAIFYIIFCSLFGYMAGACAQGMSNHKYGWKKDIIVLIFLLSSFYFGVVLVGYVSRNPV
jgi:ABC-type Mn2+/Zn2+ transport system permease subunit